MQTLNSSCPSCGSNLEFNVKKQTLLCPNCGTSVEIEDKKNVSEHDVNLALKDNKNITTKNTEITELSCESCGGKIEISPLITATSCPYCGSNIVLTKKQVELEMPDGIRPFQVDKNEAGEIFHNWIKGRFFAPNALKNTYQQDKMMAIYMPYYTFDANARANYTAMVGDNYTEHYTDSEGNRKSRIKTRWSHTSGTKSEFFNDVLVAASNSLDEKLLEEVGYFDTDNNTLKSYDPSYMLGFNAQRISLSLNDTYNIGRQKMNEMMRQEIVSQELLRHDHVNNINFDMNLSNEVYKHVILPIYSSAYMYNGKIYNVIINGQSGLIRGEYPKSPIKIALAILLALIVFFIFYYVYNNYMG